VPSVRVPFSKECQSATVRVQDAAALKTGEFRRGGTLQSADFGKPKTGQEDLESFKG